MNFKPNDRGVDLHYLKDSFKGISPKFTVVSVKSAQLMVRFDDREGLFRRYDDDRELIPESVYESPLYKILEEIE